VRELAICITYQMCFLLGQDQVPRFCLGSGWPEDGQIEDTDYTELADAASSKGCTVLLRIYKLLQVLY